jgi:hypothetical protein
MGPPAAGNQFDSLSGPALLMLKVQRERTVHVLFEVVVAAQ